ncbi:MAG: hypothetical protein ABSC33_11880 [Candidatus Sulfotelmatobacter sp.]
MKSFLFSVLVSVCLIQNSAAQNAAPPQNPGATPPSSSSKPQVLQMQFTSGTLIRVELEKPIDAKKAKVGDEVIGKTTDDLNSTPPGLATKGCKVVGHIMEVSPRQGDSVSTLRVAFDKLILKNGSDMALPAAIKAIGFAEAFDPATNSEAIGQMGSGPGIRTAQAPGGVIGSGSGDPTQYAGQRMPSGASNSANAKLPFNAKGPVGMSGVELSSAGGTQGSTLSSKKHNVKLESGMQMILRVD